MNGASFIPVRHIATALHTVGILTSQVSPSSHPETPRSSAQAPACVTGIRQPIPAENIASELEMSKSPVQQHVEIIKDITAVGEIEKNYSGGWTDIYHRNDRKAERNYSCAVHAQ